jgi:hypothetical protein
MLQVYKALHNTDDIKWHDMFSLATNQTRGYSLKLSRKRSNSTQRLHSFSLKAENVSFNLNIAWIIKFQSCTRMVLKKVKNETLIYLCTFVFESKIKNFKTIKYNIMNRNTKKWRFLTYECRSYEGNNATLYSKQIESHIRVYW